MKTVLKSGIRCAIGAVAAAFLMPVALQAAEFTVGEGGTFEVTDDNNLAANRLDITGNATLKLSGTVTGNVFPLKLNLRFTVAAKLTVATENCETVRMTGSVRDNSGGASVAFPEGVKSLVMGSASVDWNGTTFPALQSDISFSDSQGKLVLTNDVTFAKRPSCDWTVANGSRLVLMARHAIADGDFELTNYDVHIAQSESFANGAKITVPAGRNVLIRPFGFKDSASGQLSGINASITNDIGLSGGSVRHYNNNDIRGLVGTFSGDGNMYFSGNGDVTAFKGNFDWSGVLQTSGVGTSFSVDYTFVPTNGATINPVIKMTHVHGVSYKFAVEGYRNGPTSVRLTSLSQSNSDANRKPAVVHILQNQTITAGEIGGLVDAVTDGGGCLSLRDSRLMPCFPCIRALRFGLNRSRPELRYA